MVRSRGSPMTPAALSAQPSPGAGNCDLTFARRQCQPTTLALPEWDAALAADRCNCATPDRENWIRTGSHVFSRFRCIACLYTRTLSLSLEIRGSRGSRSSRCFFFFFFFFYSSFREIEFFRERERERGVGGRMFRRFVQVSWVSAVIFDAKEDRVIFDRDRFLVGSISLECYGRGDILVGWKMFFTCFFFLEWNLGNVIGLVRNSSCCSIVWIINSYRRVWVKRGFGVDFLKFRVA